MKNILLFSLLMGSLAFAGLHVGERFPHMELKDQFDRPQRVTAKDKWVVMAFEKSVSVSLSNYLKKREKGYLEKHHIKVISDISTMPSFITTMFALPKMKKYPFSVMLIRDDSGKVFERQKGKVTIYELKRNKIVSVRYLTPQELISLIEK